MGIHLLRYSHSNEHIKTHDAIHDTFAAIVRDVNFHMGQEQLHALPLTTFNSSHRQINIMPTKNGICTLANVVITDLTRADLPPQSCTIQIFVAFNAIQAKKKSYHNRHPIDQFFR
jgi:hypothetical protein